MMMMMKGTAMIRLFSVVVLVGLCHLICLTRAVPITRTQSLIMHKGPQVDAALLAVENINNHNVNLQREVVIIRERDLEETRSSSAVNTERMGLLELHDYPPTGSNDRHNPKPPSP
ncbi:uncharacterized protein LOC130946733 [Arachis stenosperma]|uniref:uncharacterized protein LOC130946733 n=1 Tax=Arachis stenosperma TaxID=217475 RepID=UPI0025AB7C5D|nr:uncharacterized protein LOC130946733 [Arachis stenosperma]